MSDTIERELEKAREALADASTLVESGSATGVVNRSYYACYHAAKAALAAEGHDPRTHAGLVSQFGEHVVGGGAAAPDDGRFLNQMQTYRQRADYGYESIPAEPSALYRRATDFVEAMEELIDVDS